MLALTCIAAFIGVGVGIYAIAPDLRRRWLRISRVQSNARLLHQSLLRELDLFFRHSDNLTNTSAWACEARVSALAKAGYLAEFEKMVGLTEAVLLNLVRSPKNQADLLTLRISYFLVRDCKMTLVKIARSLHLKESYFSDDNGLKVQFNLVKKAKILSFRKSN